MNDVEYLTLVVKGLVSQPEEVRVERTTDEQGVLLTLSLAKGDMGKIIGKMGNTAKAIRTLMHTFGYNAKEVIFVKILEPIN